jgi:hypothetical protein
MDVSSSVQLRTRYLAYSARDMILVRETPVKPGRLGQPVLSNQDSWQPTCAHGCTYLECQPDNNQRQAHGDKI